jgi:hypothetical protein
MSPSSVIPGQKTAVILKGSDHWDEWLLIIEAMAKRGKIERYVDLIQSVKPLKPLKSSTPSFSTVKDGVKILDRLIRGSAT